MVIKYMKIHYLFVGLPDHHNGVGKGDYRKIILELLKIFSKYDLHFYLLDDEYYKLYFDKTFLDNLNLNYTIGKFDYDEYKDFSVKMNKNKENSTIDRELLPIGYALQLFEFLIIRSLHPLHIFTDHKPLLHCFAKKRKFSPTFYRAQMQSTKFPEVKGIHTPGENPTVADMLPNKTKFLKRYKYIFT